MNFREFFINFWLKILVLSELRRAFFSEKIQQIEKCKTKTNR